MPLPAIATLGAPPMRTCCIRCGTPLARGQRVRYVPDDPSPKARCRDCREVERRAAR